MRTISISVDAIDTCYLASLDCRIVNVFSNEPINGLGDGSTEPDWIINSDLELQLRSERSGRGRGRTYTIDIECTDGSGNSTSSFTKVHVPKSRRK